MRISPNRQAPSTQYIALAMFAVVVLLTVVEFAPAVFSGVLKP